MSNLDALRSAAAVSPDNVPLLTLLAQAALDAFAHDEAIQTWERILKLAPRSAEARLGHARALFQAGRVSEAAVRLESWLRESPGAAPGWVLLSRIVLSEGNRKDAARHYQTAQGLPGFLKDSALEHDLYGDAPAGAPAETEKVRLTSEGPEFGDDDEDAGPEVALETPRINFGDVGGMEQVKEEIRMKILYPLQNPDLFKAYGKKIGGGVLLYGPPGCGKTLLSRATAGEMKATFLAIGLHQVLDMYIGNSEKNLHGTFELARANAPCVLFFDEVDALAADRSDFRQSAGRMLINQFLAEMDGQGGSNEGVLVLAATNAPWHLDPAFLRPGRFDRVVFVPPPDEPARGAIVEILAREKPVADLDAKAIARKTDGFSGADLKGVFDQAIERCLAAAMKEGRVVPLSTPELLRMAKGARPSTKAWFETARNYAVYANQSGLYNDVLAYLGIRT
jgi:AAA+ superfamily predicted ATPase